MTLPWKCRAYEPGDEAGIIRLYRQVFDREVSEEFWRWVYLDSPDGPAVIVVLEDNEEIVGHYAVQPRAFWESGRRCLAGIALGTMVLPKVRSVIALTTMAQSAYAICRERGYRWLYAFPNDEAHKVRCRLLEWKELPAIVDCEGPLPEPWGAAQMAVSRWEEMPQDLKLSAQIVEDRGGPVHSARTTEWLRWRFFEQPGTQHCLHTVSGNGTVTAYAVTKRYRREGVMYGHILDWQVDSASERQSAELLSSVWRQLGEWEVQRVSCWTLGNAQLERQLADIGFMPSGQRTNFCWYDLTGDARTTAGERTWQMAMADSDRY
jgi:uncharacterized protein YjiS (DUF1127 family)